jgi:hypothetical protein
MNSEFYKMSCPKCGGGIEFPEHGLGSQIECPHCRTPIVLKQQLLVTVWISPRSPWLAPTVFGSVVGAGVAVVTLILLSFVLFWETPALQKPASLQDDLKVLLELTSINSQQISKKKLQALVDDIKIRVPSSADLNNEKATLQWIQVTVVLVDAQFLLSHCYGEKWDEAEKERVKLQSSLARCLASPIKPF